jgi:hypothetical protein
MDFESKRKNREMWKNYFATFYFYEWLHWLKTYFEWVCFILMGNNCSHQFLYRSIPFFSSSTPVILPPFSIIPPQNFVSNQYLPNFLILCIHNFNKCILFTLTRSIWSSLSSSLTSSTVSAKTRNKYWIAI